jgi:hypothetical protein
MIFSIFLAGCTSKVEKCPLDTLILDVNLFPQGTFAEKIIPPSSDDPSYSRSFLYGPDAVYQEVSRWNSVRASKKYYNFLEKPIFDVDQYMGPWSIPPELNHLSLSADQYRIACGFAHHTYQFRMIATYKEYFVFFRSEISDQGIRLTTFEMLVRALDGHMTQCSSN